LGAAFSLILEEKLAFGLADPPPEKALEPPKLIVIKGYE